jgi:hypothetical protein
VIINDYFQVANIAPSATFSKIYTLHLPIIDPVESTTLYNGNLRVTCQNGLGIELQQKAIGGQVSPPFNTNFALFDIAVPGVVFSSTITTPNPFQISFNITNLDAGSNMAILGFLIELDLKYANYIT